ncbi:MAG: thioredoxin domain-containing protein [Patescibacteria group bacterium]|nr:thioredoxin domain-containing protein [Patescibacteria group bacterium]
MIHRLDKVILLVITLTAVGGGVLFWRGMKSRQISFSALGTQMGGNLAEVVSPNTDNVDQGKLFAYDEEGIHALQTPENSYLARAKSENTAGETTIEEGTEAAPSAPSADNPSQMVAGSAGYNNLAGEGNPSWGPEGAKVTIVEFSDFLCPYCAEFAKTALPQLKSKYGTRVKFVFRDLPIENIHPLSPLAHEMGECAWEQGKFWELHDLIFANSARITESLLASLAEKAGLEMTKFNTCMNQGESKLKIMEDLDAGISAGISATPTLFVNNQKVEGAVSFEELSGIIEAELNKVQN